MEFPTSTYFSAFQGLRTFWSLLRRNKRRVDEEDEVPPTEEHLAVAERESALFDAETERQVALIHAMSEQEVALVRANTQAQRLEPALQLFALVQAKKRERLASSSPLPTAMVGEG